MIGDDHQVARIEAAVDPAGCVRREVDRRAQLVHHADGKCGKLCRMSLIHVKAPSQRDNIAPAKLSCDERSCMPAYGRGGKAGDLVERNARRAFDVLSQTAEARPENDS